MLQLILEIHGEPQCTAVCLNSRKIWIPAAEAKVKTAHLSKVDSIAMAMQDGEAGVGRTLDEHAGDTVAPCSARVEHLQVLLLPVAVLPLCLVREVQLLLVAGLVLILNISLAAVHIGCE